MAAIWREDVDRVVVVGSHHDCVGWRLLMESCCHPYHNELSRAERGGKPRLYFVDDSLDNDAVAGLLDILEEHPRRTLGPDNRWSLVVVDTCNSPAIVATAKVLLAAMRQQCGGDISGILPWVATVTRASSPQHDFWQRIGYHDHVDGSASSDYGTSLTISAGEDPRFAILDAAGLLPAALLGIDIVRLLQGASDMSEHFCTTPLEDNIVLQYAAGGYGAKESSQRRRRVFQPRTKSLKSLGQWCESLIDCPSHASPIVVQLIARQWRRDALAVVPWHVSCQTTHPVSTRSPADLLSEAIGDNERSRCELTGPTLRLLLPTVDESTIGQLLQMLLLASLVEARMSPVEPSVPCVPDVPTLITNDSP